MNKLTKHMIENARCLRSHMTDAEQRLWQHLRKRQIANLKFRRQHPCGQYILDFACLSHRLAIEIDGGQHMQMMENDQRRTAWLQARGWTVLRFWNHEVMKELDAVLSVISEHVSCHRENMISDQV